MKRLFFTLTFIIQLIGIKAACSDVQPTVQTSDSIYHTDNYDELGKVPAVVHWKKIQDAAYYYLTISQSADFTKGRLFRVKAFKKHLMVYPNTHYYWRVEAFNDKGERLPFDTISPHTVTTVYEGTGNFIAQRKKVHVCEREMASTDGVSPVELTESEFVTEPAKCAPCTQKVENAMSETVLNQVCAERNIAQVQTEKQTTEVVVRVLDDYPEWLQNNKFWLTTEAGLFNFKQTHTTLSNIQASGSMFPSFGFNFQTRTFWDVVSSKLYFQQTIGSFKSDSANFLLIDSDFQFIQYGLLLQTHFHMLSKHLEMTPYLGVERQKSPYFFQLSPTTISVQDMRLDNGILGLRFDYQTAKRWIYYVDLQYAQVLSSQANSLTTTKITGSNLQGQLGAVYQFARRGFFTGAALKGATRSFKDDVVTSTNQASVGSRTSTYYALELMAGFSF
ncbi:MAG: hypothetical protein H6623_06555 [Bdellovibrionaceae bacterium]|nr:hypothetical protein [Pseudobdellovibrionaceae bacterium]